MDEQHRPGSRVTETAEPLDAPQPGPASDERPPHRPGRVTDAADPLPESDASEPTEEVPLAAQPRPWRAVAMALGGLVLASLAWLWGETLVQLWRSDAILIAAFLSVLTLVLVLALLRALLLESGAARRIDRLARQRETVTEALAVDDVEALERALEPTLRALRKDRPALIAEFDTRVQHHEHARDYARQFENLVLAPLDREAERQINRSALTASAGVTVSPHPMLDAVIVVWRAIVLIRGIGALYGLQPTGLSSLRLLRHAIVSALGSAAIETGSDLMLDELGRSLIVRSAGKWLAESAYVALRFKRLGGIAKESCRPLPADRR